MKKKPYFFLVILVAVFAFFYAKQFHIIGGASENGSPYKFYYAELDDEEKRAYDCILDKIYDMPEKITVPYLDEEQLNDVFESLLSDNPDLFFIGRKCSLNPGFMSDYFKVDYTMDKDEYLRAKKELEKEVKKIIDGLSDPENDWQTELEIHDYIIDNCKYELSDGNYLCSSSYGALVNHRAACEGYSKAAKLLLDRAKIENGIVYGKSSSEGRETAHMWNAVKINNKFYHLDCTWDDPVNDDGKPVRMYSYFNVNDEMISVSHSDFSHNFHCFSTDDNYFVRTGTLFESYGTSTREAIGRLMADRIKNGEKTLHLRFESGSVYSTARSRLVKKGEMADLISQVNKETGKNISTKKIKYIENEKQNVITFMLG